MKTLKMNKKAFCIYSGLILLFSLLTRCTVMSFYPLYTPNELVKDDRIIGKWMSRLVKEETSSDSIIWEIELQDKKWKKKVYNPVDKGNKQVKNKLTYTLKIYPAKNPDELAVFDIHIIKLKNNYYLDFLLEEMETDYIFTVMHLLPVHTFAKIEIAEEMTIKWLDGDFLEKLLDANKIRIRHEKREDASLLTAKPKELQKFIIKYSDNEDAYLDDLSFILWKMKS